MNLLTPDLHASLSGQVVEVLNAKEVFTVLDFLRMTPRAIEKLTDLSFREILELRKVLLRKNAPKSRNAYMCFQNIPIQHTLIQTGVKNLDDFLSGGIFTGNIYEVCGLPACGKTLLCLTVIKHNILKLGSPICYLDTKNDFSGYKLKQMLQSLSKEELGDALEKVQVTRIGPRDELIQRLEEIRDQQIPTKLIIIDSLFPIYLQSSDSSDRNAFLNRLANILNYLCKERHMAVVVTNLITLWSEGDFNNTEVLQEKVACGKFWSRMPQVRLRLEKSGDKGTFTLLRTTRVPPTAPSCEVVFKEEGIE